MKKQLITAAASLAVSLSAFGQGGLIVNGSDGASLTVFGQVGVANGANSGYNLYGVTPAGDLVETPCDAGFELWYKAGTSTDISTINSLNATPNAAYAMLSSSGFTLATSFTQVAGVIGGVGLLSPDQLNIAGISGTATFALVGWAGDGANFGALAGANGGGLNPNLAYGGVVAFQLPTVNYNAQPAPLAGTLVADVLGAPYTSSLGFQANDLILAPIPEPSTFALAGMGVAALLAFRRRK